MNAEIFWEIIGRYNQQTWIIQIILMSLISISFILAILKKNQWLSKISLGVTNLFIAVVFFLIFGKEPIQYFFAAPLFFSVGLLFLWDAVKYRENVHFSFNKLQWILLFLVILYPFFSMILGHSFPRLVVYIMPCPVISLSIVIYSGYHRKNIFLLLLLIIWGLTGVKAFFFDALEDTILLLCGIYCIGVLFFQLRKNREIKKN